MLLIFWKGDFWQKICTFWPKTWFFQNFGAFGAEIWNSLGPNFSFFGVQSHPPPLGVGLLKLYLLQTVQMAGEHVSSIKNVNNTHFWAQKWATSGPILPSAPKVGHGSTFGHPPLLSVTVYSIPDLSVWLPSGKFSTTLWKLIIIGKQETFPSLINLQKMKTFEKLIQFRKWMLSRYRLLFGVYQFPEDDIFLKLILFRIRKFNQTNDFL